MTSAGTITGAFRRVTGPRGAVRFTDQPTPPAGPTTRPARAARMLAVAHALSAMLAKDRAPSRAELAKALQMSEARLSQLLDLVLLAPDIQEELLFLELPPGRDRLPERALRSVVRALDWPEQRRRFARLREAAGIPGAATGVRARPRGSRSAAARPPG